MAIKCPPRRYGHDPMLVTQSDQIGISLKARRKALGLSQARFAQKLSLSQNRISELENYPETLTVQQLLAFASALGLELALTERKVAKEKAA
jgi:HTH-type transcriptional regulator / antitoxin HipB